MDSLAAQLIIKLLAHEMDLDTQQIWLRDENLLIPETKNLWVIVGLADTIGMSNQTSMEQRGDSEYQISEVQRREDIVIDILSKDSSAKLRNWEITAAMQSFYSQQLQEKNSFKICRTPLSHVNTSGAEGGSNISRYTITFACFVWYRKEKLLKSPLVDYYDKFKTRVDDEETIGTDTPVFEFEITPDTPPPYEGE